jgi:LemA protein
LTGVFLIIGGLALLGIAYASMYNRLTRLNVQVDGAWSDVTVQLKRRADLLPNLIETVKGYADHEKTVFENVTAARAATVNAGNPAAAAAAENQLQGAMKSLFAVAEAYPQLQASANFLDLQSQLVDTEDKIQASRRFYNAGVREFNTAIQVFPTNLIASSLKFSKRDFFEVADAASIQEPPAVKF